MVSFKEREKGGILNRKFKTANLVLYSNAEASPHTKETTRERDC